VPWDTAKNGLVSGVVSTSASTDFGKKRTWRKEKFWEAAWNCETIIKRY